jgi:hypothetical protein
LTKQSRYFEQVSEYKERFRKLPSETIRSRLAGGPVIKEAAIAYREVLEERGESAGTDNAGNSLPA